MPRPRKRKCRCKQKNITPSTNRCRQQRMQRCRRFTMSRKRKTGCDSGQAAIAIITISRRSLATPGKEKTGGGSVRRFARPRERKTGGGSGRRLQSAAGANRTQWAVADGTYGAHVGEALPVVYVHCVLAGPPAFPVSNLVGGTLVVTVSYPTCPETV